jgi:AcrR family transcriptional regulator
VTEITERAMVSRAAFYRNHWSKYDLVEQIFSDAMADLTPGDDARPLEQRSTEFFEHVAAYDRLYRALLGAHGSPWFAIKMRSTLAQRITEHVSTSEPTPTTRARTTPGLMPTIIAGMFVEAIIWWLAQEPRPPANEIADRASRLALAIADEASTWPAAVPARGRPARALATPTRR